MMEQERQYQKSTETKQKDQKDDNGSNKNVKQINPDKTNKQEPSQATRSHSIMKQIQPKHEEKRTNRSNAKIKQ